MEELKNILKMHNISPSLHRLKILEYIHRPYTHSTADEIFQALEKDIPTLSKTTVYNTLKTFEKNGIISALSIFENETRYEFKKQEHAHFKCEKCGEIFDIAHPFDFLKETELEGHFIKNQLIYLKGICRNCLQKTENA
ncbi:MAG: transcriptional repressor [Candidatus Cloacimonetes bacterium]|nr:transcriptional repressor [Candidatus Cloacimonadota bacterium]